MSQQSTQQVLWIAGGCTTVAGLALFEPLYALIATALCLVPFALQILCRIRPEHIFQASLFALIVLEGDYPEYDAWVKPIAGPIFSQMYVPVLSPFEITGFCLLAWLFVKYSATKDAIPLQPLRSLFLFTGLNFFVALLMVGYGLAQGGRLQVAFWQMKSFSVFPVWAGVSFLAIRNKQDAKRFLSLLLTAGIIKTVYNLQVLVLGLGGSKGTREYFTSHVGSLFMVLPMMIAGLRLMMTKVPKKTALYYILFIVATLYLWIENNRRASIMGAGISFLLAAVVVAPYVSRKLRRRAGITLAALSITTALTYELPAPTPGGILKSIMTHGNTMNEDAPDYRDIENFNLFTDVGHYPLGRGYGFPFAQYIPLPDIFSIAESLSWIPHNNMLMIWAFGGPQNLAALSILIALSIAVGVRLYRSAPANEIKIFGLVTMMTMIQWLMYVWADMAWSFIPTISVPAALVGASASLLARIEHTRMTEALTDQPMPGPRLLAKIN